MAFGKKKEPLVNSFDLLYQVTLKEDPDPMEQMLDLAEMLKENRAVLAVFRDIKDTETASYILAFLSGVVYAFNGKVSKISNETYLFATELALKDGSLTEYINEVGEK